MMGLAQAISTSLETERDKSKTFQDQAPRCRTDRSSSVPLSQAMTMADDPIIVQSGFLTRPLCDGGGNPSPGRRPPPLRPTSRLATWDLSLPFWQLPVPSNSNSLSTNTHPWMICSPGRDGLWQRSSISTSRTRKLWKRGSPSTGVALPPGLIAALAAYGNDIDAAIPRTWPQ